MVFFPSIKTFDISNMNYGPGYNYDLFNGRFVQSQSYPVEKKRYMNVTFYLSDSLQELIESGLYLQSIILRRIITLLDMLQIGLSLICPIPDALYVVLVTILPIRLRWGFLIFQDGITMNSIHHF